MVIKSLALFYTHLLLFLPCSLSSSVFVAHDAVVVVVLAVHMEGLVVIVLVMTMVYAFTFCYLYFCVIDGGIEDGRSGDVT